MIINTIALDAAFFVIFINNNAGKLSSTQFFLRFSSKKSRLNVLGRNILQPALIPKVLK